MKELLLLKEYNLSNTSSKSIYIFFSEFPARIYPSNVKATHILGYLREVPGEVLNSNLCNHKYKLGDVYGETGIEKIYECDLK